MYNFMNFLLQKSENWLDNYTMTLYTLKKHKFSEIIIWKQLRSSSSGSSIALVNFFFISLDQADKLVQKFENVSNEVLDSYPKIVDIEKNISEVAQKFVDISKQVQEITHLPKEHHESALRDLEKRSKACSEQWMHSLESLDGIQLDDTQTLSKSKRKSVADCANSYLGKKHALKDMTSPL